MIFYHFLSGRVKLCCPFYVHTFFYVVKIKLGVEVYCLRHCVGEKRTVPPEVLTVKTDKTDRKKRKR